MAMILRKWLLISSAILLLVGLGVVIGCSSNVEVTIGKYVRQDDENDYVEIKADGTYFLHNNEEDITGEWEVRGNDIIFKLEILPGTYAKFAGTVIDDEIHDEDGIVWVLELED